MSSPTPLLMVVLLQHLKEHEFRGILIQGFRSKVQLKWLLDTRSYVQMASDVFVSDVPGILDPTLRTP